MDAGNALAFSLLSLSSDEVGTLANRLDTIPLLDERCWTGYWHLSPL
jgi:hypothetical protein